MDTTALEAAYTDLLATAKSIRGPEADWTLSHIALSDRMLAAAARRSRAGLLVTIDNREAMDVDELIASTTHADRIDLVRHHAADLVTAIADLDGDAPVRLHLVTRTGTPVPDQDLPWQDLIRIRATEHLPGHAARLRRISR